MDGLLPAPSFDQPPPKLKQPDLARTLRRIAADGAGAFYTGEIADRIVGHVRSRGGILSADDLADDQPVVLEPLVLPYREVELVLLPCQASGPTTGEVLTILDGLDLQALGHNSAAALHLIADASIATSRSPSPPGGAGRDRRGSGPRTSRRGPWSSHVLSPGRSSVRTHGVRSCIIVRVTP